MFTNLPPVTKALLIANGIAYGLQLLLGNEIFAAFMLWPLSGGSYNPYSFEFLPWQLLSYGFLHGSLMHLLFNMLALLMFGAPLEYTWGNKRFLTYYLVCVVGAGLCQLAVGSIQPVPGDGLVGEVTAGHPAFQTLVCANFTVTGFPRLLHQGHRRAAAQPVMQNPILGTLAATNRRVEGVIDIHGAGVAETAGQQRQQRQGHKAGPGGHTKTGYSISHHSVDPGSCKEMGKWRVPFPHDILARRLPAGNFVTPGKRIKSPPIKKRSWSQACDRVPVMAVRP